eukprot:8560896-Alexandrium_andersonii.AAC.1
MAPRALPPTFQLASDPGGPAAADQWPGGRTRPRPKPRRDGLGEPSREEQCAIGDRLSQDGAG